MFAPVELMWADQTYVILPDRILGAVAVVEEHLTMAELAQEAQSGRMRLARLSRAFGALLRYAGARITDDEVYTGLFEGDPIAVRERIIMGVNTLMALMVPPGIAAEDAPRGNVAAAASGRDATAAAPMVKRSKRFTKRSSARAG
jgi:hypothetical protein